MPKRRVVTADRYLDVATGRYVDFPAIFVGDDGRITGIADARTVRWGADVRHINLSGKTLVPGLIDMHVHLDSPADIGGYRGLEFTDSFFGMAAVGNARAMLDAGFTTVRNVGSGNRNDVGLKQAIDDGYAVGPRIVPAGYRARRDRRALRLDLPSAQPRKAEEGRRGRRRGRGTPLPGPPPAQVRRRSDQGLRHRRRLLPQYRTRASSN